jgi:hypothetical protein
VWGSSYSGAHVLVVAAVDRRVKCVVSQVPLVAGLETARRLVRGDHFAGLRAAFDADRAARFGGAEPAMIPVTWENDPAEPCALPTADSHDFFFGPITSRAPSWKKEVTLRSVERFVEYEPQTYVPMISPTPLLLVVAEGDHLVPADLALKATRPRWSRRSCWCCRVGTSRRTSTPTSRPRSRCSANGSAPTCGASNLGRVTDSWRADGPADDEMSDRWRAVVSDTHLPWSTHVAPGPAFAASVRRWWIDDLALVDVECAADVGIPRTQPDRRHRWEFVALLFIRAGHEVIRTNGDTVRLAPGDAVVWDSTRTARFDVPAGCPSAAS